MDATGLRQRLDAQAGGRAKTLVEVIGDRQMGGQGGGEVGEIVLLEEVGLILSSHGLMKM